MKQLTLVTFALTMLLTSACSPCIVTTSKIKDIGTCDYDGYCTVRLENGYVPGYLLSHPIVGKSWGYCEYKQ